jgi:lysozyme
MPEGNNAGATPASNNRKKLVALVGAGAAASLIIMIPQFEGTVLKGYRDPIGIPTKCMGDTHNVVVGKTYTKAECDESMAVQLIAHAEPLVGPQGCVKNLTKAAGAGYPGALPAAVDLAYNIGAAKFCRSTAARYFRMSRWPEGCRALGAFKYAGGRVLPGLAKRRAAEVRLCLTGKM